MNRPIITYVLRSLAATTLGWLLFGAVVLIFAALMDKPTAEKFMSGAWREALGWCMYFLTVSAFWFFPAWLVLIFPLALFVPQKRKLWRPLASGVIGLLIGVLFTTAWFYSDGSSDSVFLLLGCATGTAGLLIGLLMSYFMRKQTKALVSR